MALMLRQADTNDYPAIHRLMQDFSCFIGTPEKFRITVEQMLREKEHIHCFVAVESATGEIIGYATYFIAYYTWSGKSMYLDDLYVVEPHRGNGIGKKLIEAVIAQARKEDCAKLRWQVSRWNKRAIGFYKSLGATVDDVEWNCDLPLR
ncbi:MAG: N-acetyltransferase family protein [Acidobacteriota bacterium]